MSRQPRGELPLHCQASEEEGVEGGGVLHRGPARPCRARSCGGSGCARAPPRTHAHFHTQEVALDPSQRPSLPRSGASAVAVDVGGAREVWVFGG